MGECKIKLSQSLSRTLPTTLIKIPPDQNKNQKVFAYKLLKQLLIRNLTLELYRSFSKTTTSIKLCGAHKRF